MDGKLLTEKLIAYAGAHLSLDGEDVIYLRNTLLALFGLDAPLAEEADVADAVHADVPDRLLEEVACYAKEHDLCGEGEEQLYAVVIFGMLMPRPSEVNRTFRRVYAEQGAQAACDYLYRLSVKSGYVQKTAIARNLKWTYDDGKSGLEITVNLSKPEKSNKDIAKLLAPSTDRKYPLCALCKENEGFKGSAAHPPRGNLRTVDLTLGGEEWFLQYSPYAYYEEHCIAINKAHTPMHMDAATPEKLLDFVDLLPNYFIGSNAPLPIVGGSILNHEHFQGGKHLMPMHRAKMERTYRSAEFPTLSIGILDWYNSAVRCSGTDRKEVSRFAAKVIGAWENFDCPACNILSHTGEVRHNACSPICRKEGDKYIFTIILRNNRTDEQYPDGIFHVHPEYLNIKSEGIGLIEAMGLFILPPRLKRQLEEIAKILCGQTQYNAEVLADPAHDFFVHRNMIRELLAAGGAADLGQAKAAVCDYVGRVCAAILDNTAVFKRDDAGRAGFAQFMESILN